MPEKLANVAGSVTGIDSKQAIKEAVCVHTQKIYDACKEQHAPSSIQPIMPATARFQ